MADNQIVTNIVATSDFSNLITDVNRVTNSLAQLQQSISTTNKQLQSQVAVMNRSFAETIRSTGQFSTHFVSLTSDVEKFGKNLDTGRLKLRDYFRVYQDHIRTSGGLIRDLAKQQVQLQNAIVQPLGRNSQGLMQFNVHIPRGLDAIKNKTALARQELQIMNKVIQDGGIQLINWGKNTQWAGRQLTVGLTLPLAAFGKAAADAFRQADQELTRLTKVYGDIAGASQKELGSIRKEVAQTSKELAATMGVNFKETIALAADIAATGKTGNDLLGSIKETTRLAVLGEVDRQDAMKATLAIQSAFKQNTEELANSINFLNAVENQTSTTLNDLVEAIPKAGPVIKGLGGSVQDLALYLTAMREGGISASEGANALKSALASLINPTDKAVAKFKTLGIDLVGIVQKNAGSTTNTLLALQAALDKLNPLQKQQAIEQLFGKFQYSRLNALFENLGRQGSQTLQVLDLMKASTSQLGAIADRELTAVTESASGRFRRATESLKANLAGIGEQFLNIGTKLVNAIDKVISFLDKLPDPVKNILALGGAFTAITGPIIMLTGLMANFIGYIIKGYGHIKALIKGGEGFRLLTPQMMAAEKAASLVAESLYSDAKAAEVLHQALTMLKNDFRELQAIAASGGISVSPTISTMSGGIVVPGQSGRGYRPVNPASPFVSGRAASHINPRDPNNPASIFGLVPGSDLVNMLIKRNPQIFMEERLPNIEGLTSIGAKYKGKKYDISTGIVASEAARHQALMATLGMQSKQEIEELKRTIEMGGAVSTDFIATFDDILPITTRLSTNAARESAAIVAELRAGKITVEAARNEIIRINAQLEAGLISEVGQFAALRGRSIDPTKIPLIDQPAVDPITGKPNTRALYRTGRTLNIMEALGRATRTRTLGAPYSIETTLPPRYNAGGKVRGYIDGGNVYTTDGSTVPGPNINADVVPAVLTPGEFVLTRGTVQREGEAAVQALHEGRATIVPTIGANKGGMIPKPQRFLNGGGVLRILKNLSASQMKKLIPSFRGSKKYYNAKGVAGVYIGDITDPKILAKYPKLVKDGKISRQAVNAAVTEGRIPGDLFAAAIRSSGANFVGSADQFLFGLLQNGIITGTQFKNISKRIEREYFSYLSRSKGVGDINNEYWRIANSIITSELGRTSNAGHLWRGFSSSFGAHTSSNTLKTGKSGGSTSPLVIKVPDKKGKVINFGALEGSADYLFAHTKTPDPLIARARKELNLNRGGMVPGYRRGGGVVRTGRFTYGDNVDWSRTPFGLMQSGRIPSPLTGGTAPAAAATLSRGRAMGAMAARFGTGMLGSTIGMQFGLPGALVGGLLGDMLGAKLARSIEGTTKKVSLLQKSLSFLKRNPFALAIGGASGFTAAMVLVNNKIEEHRKIVTASFGVTSSTAEKLKINYFDINEQLKQMRENYINTANTATAAMAGIKKVGFTGTNMTMSELLQLKELVKGDEGLMQVVQSFNVAAGTEMPQKAANFKASLVSMGMSVEDANELLLAMIQLSNKAGSALSILANMTFTQIDDKASAAANSLKTFGTELSKGSDQTGEALNTALGGYTELENSLVNITDKNKDIVTQGEAYSKIVEKLNVTEAANIPIKKKGYDQIVAIKDELKLIVNEQDTFSSILAKTRIQAAGLAVDLKGMAVETAQAISMVLAAQRDVLTSQTGPLAILVKAANSSQAAAESTIKNSQKTQDEYRKEIKIIQERIKKIKEEAAARRKALEEQQEDEDILTEIKKKQLEYQDALAVGDLSAASAAQLDIQSLVNRQQRTLTERAITEDEERRIKIEEDKINALENLIDGLDAAISKALERVETGPTEREKTAQNLLEKVTDLALRLPPKGTPLTTDQRNEIQSLILELEKAGYKTLAKTLGLQTGGIRGTPIYGIQGLGMSTALQNIDLTGTNAKLDAILQQLQKGIPITNLPGATPTLNVKPTTTTLPSGTKTTFISQRELEAAGVKKIYAGPLDKVGTYTGTEFVVGQDRYVVKSQIPNTQNYAVQKKAMGGSIKKYPFGSTDGPIQGPGTGTSDSIIARVSDGEFVTRATSVSDVGIDNMHLINVHGAQGVMAAAKNLSESSNALGGLPKFVFGGIVPKLSFKKLGELAAKGFGSVKNVVGKTYTNLMDYLGMTSKDPLDEFPFEPQLAKETMAKRIDSILKNRAALPQLPVNEGQAKLLAKQYNGLVKMYSKSAKKEKSWEKENGYPRLVGDFNKNISDAKNLMNNTTEYDYNPIIKDFMDRLETASPEDFSKPVSGDDKAFWDIVTNPEIGQGGRQDIPGLNTPDLFSGLAAPDSVSLYDYYMGKVAENKIIRDTYKDILKLIQTDPKTARKLGLGLAKGGYIPRFSKGSSWWNVIKSGFRQVFPEGGWEGSPAHKLLQMPGKILNKAYRTFFPEKATGTYEIQKGKFGDTVKELDLLASPESVKYTIKGSDAVAKQKMLKDFVRMFMYQGKSEKDALDESVGLLNNLGLKDLNVMYQKELQTDSLRRFYTKFINKYTKLGYQWPMSKYLAEDMYTEFLADPRNEWALGMKNSTFKNLMDKALSDVLNREGAKQQFKLANTEGPKPPGALERFRNNLANKGEILTSTIESIRTRKSGSVFGPSHGEIVENIDIKNKSSKDSVEGAKIIDDMQEFWTNQAEETGIRRWAGTGPKNPAELFPKSEYEKDLKNVQEMAKFKKWLEGISPEDFQGKAFGGVITNVGNTIADLQLLKRNDKSLTGIYKFDKGGKTPTLGQKAQAAIQTAAYMLGFDDINAVMKDLAGTGPQASIGNYGWTAATIASAGLARPVSMGWKSLVAQRASDSALKGATRTGARIGAKVGIPSLLGLALLGIPSIYNEKLQGIVGSGDKLAGGGYINPSYYANMKMPSFESGVKYLYGDTIAQLHKKEAVLPEDMNPWNPSAKNPIGGNNIYYVSPTINAAPGMDIEQLTDVATRKIVDVLAKNNSNSMAKVGESLSMTRRYNG
jgi:TP901 family phage tail tape measure protein